MSAFRFERPCPVTTSYDNDQRVETVSDEEYHLPDAWVRRESGMWRTYTYADRLIHAAADLDEAIAVGLGVSR